MTSSHKSTVLSVVAVIVSLNVLDLPPPGSAADQPPAITVKPPSIPNPIAANCSLTSKEPLNAQSCALSR